MVITQAAVARDVAAQIKAAAAATTALVAAAAAATAFSTYRADDGHERLSLMLFRYSDGLMRCVTPSCDLFGKLGGTNGSTSCLLTKLGPPERGTMPEPATEPATDAMSPLKLPPYCDCCSS